MAKGNFQGHTRKRFTLWQLHIWINWPCSTQHSKQFSLNPTVLFRRQCGSGPSDHQRTTRQILGYVRRVQRVDLHWLFERRHLGHSIMIKYVRTAEQSADILTKGMFTTMQWKSFCFAAIHTKLWIKKSFQLCSLTFLLLSSSKVPTDASGDESSRECLRFGKSFDFGAFEQLRVYLYSRQEGSSCRKSLQSESGGRFLATWHLFSYHENTKLFVRQLVFSKENCRRCTRQEFTSSQTQLCVWEEERWVNQMPSKPKYGMPISSKTGKQQE